MKTLTAFWHWVDNERPEAVTEKHLDRLTYEEQRAIGVACELVLERLDSSFDDYDDCACADWRAFNALRDHWPAVRDLSLSICRGLEAMHEAVPEPEALAVATPMIDYCLACRMKPCSGTHMNCDMARYMRENPDKARDVLGSPPPLQDWIPEVRELGAMFRREYLGEWVTEQQRAIEQSQRNTEIQLAAQMAPPVRITREAITTYVSGEYRPAVDPGRGRVVHVGVDLGNEPARTFRAQVRSRFLPNAQQLEIFTSVTVAELDGFRGLRPRSIVLRGEPGQYGQAARAYLGHVLGPMLVDGAVAITPDCKLELDAWAL